MSQCPSDMINLLCHRNRRIKRELVSMVWEVKFEDLEFLPLTDLQPVMSRKKSDSIISLGLLYTITPLVTSFLFYSFAVCSIFIAVTLHVPVYIIIAVLRHCFAGGLFEMQIGDSIFTGISPLLVTATKIDFRFFKVELHSLCRSEVLFQVITSKNDLVMFSLVFSIILL